MTLYDGRLPSLFREGQLRWRPVRRWSTHFNPTAVIAEPARLAFDRLLAAVPDMSAIPRGYHHGVVSWGCSNRRMSASLRRSLEALLAPTAKQIETARNGQGAWTGRLTRPASRPRSGASRCAGTRP